MIFEIIFFSLLASVTANSSDECFPWWGVLIIVVTAIGMLGGIVCMVICYKFWCAPAGSYNAFDREKTDDN